MIDKKYCMSSYLAFRFIENDNMEFSENLHHHNIKKVEQNEKKYVRNADEIDRELQKVFDNLKNEKIGIMLSGGMDSAILASYMQGCDAYTFRWHNNFNNEEINRAEYYAKTNSLKLHYVDINWDIMNKNLELIMQHKGAPVHSIEPQIYQASKIAQIDKIDRLIVGESADLVFGGMDQLLAKDWTISEFAKRYTFVDPKDVLKFPDDIYYLYKRYQKGDKFDFLSFMDDVFAIESSSSYLNSFATAQMLYLDPYAKLEMSTPFDLNRIRKGETKYLVRDLFRIKYPNFPVPNKTPMPRAVDYYFSDYKGPTRSEFIDNLDMSKFTGNQKWQIYCLEKFLDMLEK